MNADARIVRGQLGREPKAVWRVAQRCSHGRPAVIANRPTLDDGTPFPTLYWLTCPHLADVVSERESEGGADEWAARIAADGRVRFEVLASDQQYRAAREMEGRGVDPCGDVGIAGQSDPTATKCLHAHVATFLAGIPDPIGRETLSGAELECPGDDCASFLADPSA